MGFPTSRSGPDSEGGRPVVEIIFAEGCACTYGKNDEKKGRLLRVSAVARRRCVGGLPSPEGVVRRGPGRQTCLLVAPGRIGPACKASGSARDPQGIQAGSVRRLRGSGGSRGQGFLQKIGDPPTPNFPFIILIKENGSETAGSSPAAACAPDRLRLSRILLSAPVPALAPAVGPRARRADAPLSARPRPHPAVVYGRVSKLQVGFGPV